MEETLVAWGASKLLQLYLRYVPDHNITFVVDSYYSGTSYHGLPVRRPEALKDETVVVFATSSKKGGVFLIGDYVVEEGGFVGVKKAADEFFGKELPAFWQNTMAVAQKK